MKAILLLALLPLTALCQGPLAPSAPPAPTMKTLDQVEARLPIPGGTSAYTIAQNGSYYLTGNITVSAGNGITVSATGNVSIDLNGYTIASTASSPDGAGIYCSTALGDVAIRNGSIAGATTFSFSTFTFAPGGFGDGVDVIHASNVLFDHVKVSGVGGEGLYAAAVGSAVASYCETHITAGDAIILPQLTSAADHCVAYVCGASGVTASEVSDCNVSRAMTGAGIAATNAINSTAASNTAIGLYCSSTATNCNGTSSTTFGIYCQNALNCTGTSSSGTAISGLLVVNSCYGFSGSGVGITARSVINSIGETNGNVPTAYGIDATATGMAIGCTAGAGGANGVSLRAKFANGCNLETGATAITTRYNMP